MHSLSDIACYAEQIGDGFDLRLSELKRSSSPGPCKNLDHYFNRFMYELAVPSAATSEEKENFIPEPLDGEVQNFEVNSKYERRGKLMTYHHPSSLH